MAFNKDYLILIGGSASATRQYLYLNKAGDDVTSSYFFSERDLNLGDQITVVSGTSNINRATYTVTEINNLDATVTISNSLNNASTATLASSATKLATARKINGVSFDGSTDITVVDSTKAPLASPALTGTPTAPTPATNTNNTQIATTAFVKAQLASPSITGSCTTNGTTDNTLVLAGIVPALALEVGDVIQITGSTDGLNDKLFTVESITDDNSIIVNYEHAGNRGNGSLKLSDQSGVSVTCKRIAKWYNAPIGLGQAWVNVKVVRSLDVNYSNTTGRALYALVDLDKIDITVDGGVIKTGATYEDSASFIVPSGREYRAKGGNYKGWVELR